MSRLHPRTPFTCDPTKAMTKTSFAEECDINAIMAKFTRTGVISHYAKHAPTYGDVPAIEYMDALQLVIDADLMFSELPSEIRKKFDNDPAKFLEFTADPKNLAEMRELGLAKPTPPLPGQTTDAASKPNQPAPASNEPETTKESKATAKS